MPPRITLVDIKAGFKVRDDGIVQGEKLIVRALMKKIPPPNPGDFCFPVI